MSISSEKSIRIEKYKEIINGFLIALSANAEPVKYDLLNGILKYICINII
jgi:hypothetical protein